MKNKRILLNEKLMPYEERYRDRTLRHINLVKKYGRKIEKNYSDHDNDKLHELFTGYALMMKQDEFSGGTNLASNPAGLTAEEQDAVNEATFKHVTSNMHHPEYWADPPIKKFDRYNPEMGLHCESMSDEAIQEMMADWCACSEEFKNTPYEWKDKVIPARWIFTDEQCELMDNILAVMWGKRD